MGYRTRDQLLDDVDDLEDCLDRKDRELELVKQHEDQLSDQLHAANEEIDRLNRDLDQVKKERDIARKHEQTTRTRVDSVSMSMTMLNDRIKELIDEYHTTRKYLSKSLDQISILKRQLVKSKQNYNQKWFDDKTSTGDLIVLSINTLQDMVDSDLKKVKTTIKHNDDDYAIVNFDSSSLDDLSDESSDFHAGSVASQASYVPALQHSESVISDSDFCLDLSELMADTESSSLSVSSEEDETGTDNSLILSDTVSSLTEGPSVVNSTSYADTLATDLLDQDIYLQDKLPKKSGNQDEKIHAKLPDGTQIAFKDHYMDHAFTKDEVQELLHGRPIKINVTTKKKEKYQVPSKLARQSFVGLDEKKITYWGFEPNWKEATRI